MIKVAVSIVNFNTKKLTVSCIKSITEKKWDSEVEIWVVDNASSDGSVGAIKKDFPKVHLIQSSKNLGFGKAHNLVLNKAKVDYYLILNSDTEMGKGVIDEMVKLMEGELSLGIASCRVLGFDGKLQPNAGDLPFGFSLMSWLFNLESFGIKKPAFHRVDESYYENIHEVGWVSGNFMMIRRAVLDSVGQFNEDYFMYFEDVEYCYRVKKAGFTILINPRVSIKHLSGGSLDDPKYRQWSGEYKGLVTFYRKLYGITWAMILKIVIYLSIFLRIVAFALVGNFSYSKTYAKVIFKF